MAQARTTVCGCRSSFPPGGVPRTFTCPPAGTASGGLAVSINSSSGGLCLPAGNYTCAFTVKGKTMGYDCTGSGSIKYKRM